MLESVYILRDITIDGKYSNYNVKHQLSMFKKIYWPLDVDSTDHHHLTIVRVCYKCFFFSPQEEKQGNVDITKTDALISW